MNDTCVLTEERPQPMFCKLMLNHEPSHPFVVISEFMTKRDEQMQDELKVVNDEKLDENHQKNYNTMSKKGTRLLQFLHIYNIR